MIYFSKIFLIVIQTVIWKGSTRRIIWIKLVLNIKASLAKEDIFYMQIDLSESSAYPVGLLQLADNGQFRFRSNSFIFFL